MELNEYGKRKKELENASAALADEWKAKYKQGDRVLYNGELYLIYNCTLQLRDEVHGYYITKPRKDGTRPIRAIRGQYVRESALTTYTEE